MKDSNDNATLDWVDFVGEPELVTDGELLMPTYTPENPTGFYITENAALDKALNRIVNITLQDLLAEYN
jgi:hypothetical protein